MDRLVRLVTSASKTRNSNDDDFADRLSSRYTVVLLVVFAILVSMNQYVRNPITCWTPKHFTGPHSKYTTNYCWIRNTYYLPWNAPLPRQHDHRQMIPYYQWIPFILLGQAIFFYIPTIFWHGLNSRAGVDADNILAAAHTLSRADKVELQDRTLLLLTNQMDRFLASRTVAARAWFQCSAKSLLSATCCRLGNRRFGNYLVTLFLFSKLCYIVNVVGQLFVLNRVLSTRYSTFGVDMLNAVVSESDWTEDSYVAFPRVTLCDFKVRGQDLGNVQTYTVQCVLPVNLYNEKIYMFLWFWMMAVALASVVSFIVWLFRAALLQDRLKFVGNHLALGSRLPASGRASEDRRLVRKFVVDYLRQDGAFLFRLIAHNTNNITTTEVVCALWDFWNERPSKIGSSDALNADSTDSVTLRLKQNAK